MKCPFCGEIEDRVIDSRSTKQGDSIRRRRECLKCARRFTTYERAEEMLLMVVKRDGRRQPFDRKKILRGIMRACEKRPISIAQMDEIVTNIERELTNSMEKEISSVKVGSMVVDRLRDLDQVAYVRFASVYRSFRDINEFMDELKALLS